MTLSTSAVAVCCCREIRGQFVEQPGVLNSDDGLGGEVLHKLDLLVGKGTNFLARQGERTDEFVLFKHGDI